MFSEEKGMDVRPESSDSTSLGVFHETI